MEVLDLTGRVVLREGAVGDRLLLDVSALAEGVYTLRCTTVEGQHSVQFVNR